MSQGPFRMRVAHGSQFSESSFVYRGLESGLEVHWRIYYCADIGKKDITFNRVRSVVHSGRKVPASHGLVMKIMCSNYNRFNMKFDVEMIMKTRQVLVVGGQMSQNLSSRRVMFPIPRSGGEINFDICKEDKLIVMDDALEGSCELEVVFDISDSNPHTPNPFVVRNSIANATHQQFVDQLKKMYEDKKYTDFSIVVGSKRFDVHKLVLAARSPVFNAMFERDFSESAQNRVVITDFEADAVHKFMDFFYTGECYVEEHAVDLLALAEKYDVEVLKFKCEHVLARRLKCENAANILQIADCHRADSLKKAALKFICDNLKELMSTPEWVSIPKELLNEILMSLSEKSGTSLS